MTPSSASYFHLAIGYYNIVLSSLVPQLPTADLFWHRARETKAQTVRAIKSPFLLSRAQETAQMRCQRATEWARIDDGQTVGLGLGVKMPITSQISTASKVAITPAAPQKALMGVSMLGNLDGMYRHRDYPSLHLESLTTGSRQRRGGLLFGKLWVSLGYDQNGFQEGVIERFWLDLHEIVHEVMLSD
ncbi:hypothetical protein P7C73_g1640, partial [Tremellales sp. Uapishka_1]